MFWDTLVMAEAVKLAEERVGPMGRYLEKPEYASVGLYTHEAGKFWYGDIDTAQDAGKLDKLADELNETLYVIPDLSDQDSQPLHKQALREYYITSTRGDDE